MKLSRTQAAGWCAALSLVGLLLAGYLAYLHIGLLRGELLGGAVCSASGAFNCHAVTGGSWGRWFGIPLAFWGAMGYVVALALGLFGTQSEEAASAAIPLIVVLSSLFLIANIWLLAIMAFVIRLFCLLCLLTDAVNLALLLVSLSALGAPWGRAVGQAAASLRALAPGRRNPGAALFWGAVVLGLIGVASVHAATTFVAKGSSADAQHHVREYVQRQARVAVDVTGDPRKGSPAAPVQLVEFSDFHCPACQRAAKFNEIILANHRRDATLLFKHFPLDTNCNDKISRMVHPGACQLAAASECAHEQDKFWVFHDMVFEQGAKYNLNNLEGDITRLGIDLGRYRACMDAGRGMDAVKKDVAEGGKIQVGSTPTYVVNGLPMAGGLSPAVFDQLLEVLHESGK